MRALRLFDRVRSRHALPLALCAGVLALSGCPKMPRISSALPSPDASTTSTATPTPSSSPSTEATPTPSPTPNDEPTRHEMTVGTSPQRIVIDMSGNGYVVLDEDLVRIDGAIGDLKNTKFRSLNDEGFTLGAPVDVAQVGETTWFADRSGKKIRRLPSGPSTSTDDIAFEDAPGRLAKDNQNNLWIAAANSSVIGVVKADPFATPFTATLAGDIHDFLVDPSGHAWALLNDGPTVKISKLTRRQVGQDITGIDIHFKPEPELKSLVSGSGLFFDNQAGLWVTGVGMEGNGQLMQLDPSNGSSIKDYNLGTFKPGRFAIRGDFAWILDGSDSGTEILKYSLVTQQIVKFYYLGGRGAEVVKDVMGDLWVPVSSSNTVVKLDF